MQIQTLARDKLGIERPYRIHVSVAEPCWLRYGNDRQFAAPDGGDVFFDYVEGAAVEKVDPPAPVTVRSP